MASRASKTVLISGSKNKLARADRYLDSGADAKLKPTGEAKPQGAQATYQSKGQVTQSAFYHAGVYASGRRARPHGFLSAGGSRNLKTGSQQVVTQVSGRPLF